MMLIRLMSFLRSFAPATAHSCLPSDDGQGSAGQVPQTGAARKQSGILLFRH